jgi:anti-sigma B factor antagonist
MTAPQDPSPGLNIFVVDGVTVIAFGTDFSSIDEQRLDAVRPELLRITEQGTLPTAVVVDLSHTKFFGSSFIEVLFRIWKRVSGAGGKFALAGLSGYCLEILTVTHLDTLWKNHPTRAAAIAAVKS